MKSTEIALNAETILMTERNLQPSLPWLRSIGMDAPDFPARTFIQQAAGVTYSIASNSDIAREIDEGIADFALFGSDKAGELATDTKLTFEPLGNLTCRFALISPKDTSFAANQEITVATSYPRALAAFAEQTGVRALCTRIMSGKVERAPASGLTDAAFDIVETGKSLRANGLRIVYEGPPLQLGGLWTNR